MQLLQDERLKSKVGEEIKQRTKQCDIVTIRKGQTPKDSYGFYTPDLWFIRICIAMNILKLSLSIIRGLQFGTFYLEFGYNKAA